MDAEALEIVDEHREELRRIDKKIAALLALFVSSITDSLGGDSYTLHLAVEAAADKFNTEYKAMLDEAVSGSLDAAKRLMRYNITAYRAKVEKALLDYGAGYAKTASILVSLEPYLLSSAFGSSRDMAIAGRITGKIWPDGLMVFDRINLLSKRLKIEADKIIRQGEIEGTGFAEVSERLTERFENGPERYAATRLAAHTANMVFFATQAELVRDIDFIEGIHIKRADDGSEKCTVCLDHAGPVGGEGKKYLKSDGDNLWVMASQPPYHVNCRCFVEEIFEPVQKFVQQHI